jgi:hypothetical protein
MFIVISSWLIVHSALQMAICYKPSTICLNYIGILARGAMPCPANSPFKYL